jgi:hypothetical protein
MFVNPEASVTATSFEWVTTLPTRIGIELTGRSGI